VFAYLVGNMATTARLLDGLEADSLGVNFDPSHFPYHDEDPVPFIRRFGSRIVHAHLKDAVVRDASQDLPNAFPMRDGRKFAFAPPGEGCLDFARILCALRDTGFDGVLSLELGHGVSDPRRAARRTVGFVRGVCEQCGIPIGNPGKRSC